MADRIGQQLGNYRLIRLLGQGGFAEVYLGEHVYLKTLGAIKLLHTKGANQQELEGFLKEARAIACARGVGSSPTIANGMVYVGADDSTFYAFDATCRNACKPLWSYVAGGNIFSSAAVANGMVYVGSDGGNFYAFGLSN